MKLTKSARTLPGGMCRASVRSMGRGCRSRTPTALQLLVPLATCFPGMIYRVLNPHLDDSNATYPGVVAAVMKWENIFRYSQDLWAPMAAPVVVIFLAAALWQK